MEIPLGIVGNLGEKDVLRFERLYQRQICEHRIDSLFLHRTRANVPDTGFRF